MTKLMDRLDLQIRLHLAIKHLLTVVIYNFGKFPANNKLEEWYTLSWKEFSDELKSAGISINNELDKLHLQETFEEQKIKVLFLKEELRRHDEIVSNNKVSI